MSVPLRARRATFWYLASDRIVAAVVARAEREPLLEACAASYSPPVAGSLFAPGVLEIAWVLGCEKAWHVAALAAPFCRVGSANRSPADEHGGDAISGCSSLVSGAEGLTAWADEAAVAHAAAMFRRARLRLAALDCEPCALASLAEALGSADTEGARRQHLAAVSVLAGTEGSAEALGGDLAVPVGLAVAWFGAGRAH
ncbi:MAG TPA: hypothetical protein VGK20_18875 [Candidatus Binatia bacterium]|jgi:hypothetical protein